MAVLAERAAALASAKPAPLTTDAVDAALAKGGSSLGGAFPKTTAHLPFSANVLDKREILVGGPTPAGHVPCVLKAGRLPPFMGRNGLKMRTAHAGHSSPQRRCVFFFAKRDGSPRRLCAGLCGLRDRCIAGYAHRE